MSDTAGLLKGRFLVFTAGIFWSTGGLLVRLAETADSWQIVFYRSLFVVPFLITVLALRNRGAVAQKIRQAGGRAVLGGFFLSGAFTCFVLALEKTSVANVLFVLSAIPFLAAVGGRLLLGESVRRATWAMMAVGSIGLFVMVEGELGGDGMEGMALGFVAALCFSAYTVALRSGQARDMTPAVCWAGVFGSLFAGSALILQGGAFAVPAYDLDICMTMAVGQIGFGLLAYTAGSKVVPAAELGLISLTEVVFGPIWAWLVVNEVPHRETLIGGAILLGAIAANALTGMRRKRPPPMV